MSGRSAGGSASGSGPEGPQFKSGRPDQIRVLLDRVKKAVNCGKIYFFAYYSALRFSQTAGRPLAGSQACLIFLLPQFF